MAKKVLGLASVKISDIASDGGMGSDFFTVGETVKGSANLTSEDNTVTDFEIEESDSPIESVVTAFGKLLINWSSFNIGFRLLYKLFGGTGNLKQASGSVNALGTLTGGSGYTSGYYEDVALTGGTGTGARANIKIVAGIVTSVEMTALGSGYTAADDLSASTATIGAGTGFSQDVSTVHSAAAEEKWEAPDAFPDIEKSVQVTDSKGNVTKFPRVKLSSKFGISYTKDALGQIDISGTVLQPTKSGEKRYTQTFAS